MIALGPVYCYHFYMTIKNMEAALSVGGKTNSLCRVPEIIDEALSDKALLDELYRCMFSLDPWVRMRAADAFEKVCRLRPQWIEPYLDAIQADLSDATQQASVQWHIAQMYRQVQMTKSQKQYALRWLTKLLSSDQLDWIVSVNAMKTLMHFTSHGDYPKDELLMLLKIQLKHKSKAVVKKAQACITDLTE